MSFIVKWNIQSVCQNLSDFISVTAALSCNCNLHAVIPFFPVTAMLAQFYPEFQSNVQL